MTFNDDDNPNADELSAAERAALAALPRELAPSRLLEERVVRALRATGHIGEETLVTRRTVANAWRIAAGIALFAGGVATGRYILTPDTPRSAVIAPQSERGVESVPATRSSNGLPPGSNHGSTVALETWL